MGFIRGLALLAVAWTSLCLTSLAVDPPYRLTALSGPGTPIYGIPQNAHGDLVGSWANGSVVQIRYWKTDVEPAVLLNSDLFDTRAAGRPIRVFAFNDAGDVVASLRASGDYADWVLWRTGRGNTGQTLLTIPMADPAEGIAMNRDGDVTWRSWSQQYGMRTFVWHPGDSQPTPIPKRLAGRLARGIFQIAAIHKIPGRSSSRVSK